MSIAKNVVFSLLASSGLYAGQSVIMTSDILNDVDGDVFESFFAAAEANDPFELLFPTSAEVTEARDVNAAPETEAGTEYASARVQSDSDVLAPAPNFERELVSFDIFGAEGDDFGPFGLAADLLTSEGLNFARAVDALVPEQAVAAARSAAAALAPLRQSRTSQSARTRTPSLARAGGSAGGGGSFGTGTSLSSGGTAAAATDAAPVSEALIASLDAAATTPDASPFADLAAALTATTPGDVGAGVPGVDFTAVPATAATVGPASVAAVPVPASGLLLLGALGVGAVSARKRKQRG